MRREENGWRRFLKISPRRISRGEIEGVKCKRKRGSIRCIGYIYIYIYIPAFVDAQHFLAASGFDE